MPASQPLFDHLQDMFAHMDWADAIWFRLWAKSGFQEDPDLLQRMQHTADVQGAFLMVLHEQEVLFPGDPPVPEFHRLRALTRSNHEAFAELFQVMEPEDIFRTVLVPWFPGPPCRVTVADALTQVAMHTQHHRGQFMTRLKALGGKPQNVDFIIWAWKDRPAGRWD
ncbi:MAG: DinB family protein [Holophaga sp.]|nr:DinB family protein [Holophaga sp.]